MLDKTQKYNDAMIVILVGLLASIGAISMQSTILWLSVAFSSTALLYQAFKMEHQLSLKLTGQKTAKSIKAIDILSHETNLVALQTAMDTAEAESNNSSNSIAKRVRQLALRTADAAQSTYDLIHSNVSDASKGPLPINSDKVVELTSLLEQSKKSFSNISTLIEKQKSDDINEINQVVTRIEEIISEGVAA